MAPSLINCILPRSSETTTNLETILNYDLGHRDKFQDLETIQKEALLDINLIN